MRLLIRIVDANLAARRCKIIITLPPQLAQLTSSAAVVGSSNLEKAWPSGIRNSRQSSQVILDNRPSPGPQGSAKSSEQSEHPHQMQARHRQPARPKPNAIVAKIHSLRWRVRRSLRKIGRLRPVLETQPPHPAPLSPDPYRYRC